MDIESHHEAYGLPTPGTSEPSICTSLKQFDTLLGNNDAPSILDDWIYLDRPALDIYIIKFANATLVRVTCCTFTWMGQQSKTCSMVDDSAAWPRGPSSPVPWVYEGVRENGVHTQGVDCEVVDADVGCSHCLRTRLVRVPIAREGYERIGRVRFRVRKSRRQGRKAVHQRRRHPPSLESQNINRTINPSPPKPISILNALNIRPIVPDIFPTNAAYMGNAIMLAFTYLPFASIDHNPLSTTASQIRQSIVTQRTREQIEAFAAVERQSSQQTGQPPIVGSPNMLNFVCSNWHQSRYFDVDFSPAVVRHGLPEGERMPMASITYIMGKDAKGGRWLVWQLQKRIWRGVQRQFDEGLLEP
ncbi:hypothetical protein SI65_03865 [Aspergillus cristatus]|uniref:Uncharacterized protein n=1 Tax=Aspergillus cristatus TaxID=573508 RepID=A0A1E3BIL3_ASPCR|nr:hypothetical protein SI65_03865 [Aspergillus cristatus]